MNFIFRLLTSKKFIFTHEFRHFIKKPSDEKQIFLSLGTKNEFHIKFRERK